METCKEAICPDIECEGCPKISPDRVTATEVKLRELDHGLLSLNRCKGASKLTGGSSDYYKVKIDNPTTPFKVPYEAECNDIIEALEMNFAEGNAFKAIWRKAAARQNNGKQGTTALYDSEKVEFFGKRLVAQEKRNEAR